MTAYIQAIRPDAAPRFERRFKIKLGGRPMRLRRVQNRRQRSIKCHVKQWVPRRPEVSDGAEMPRVAFPRLRRGDGERPRTEQGQTTFETGSRKPAGLQAASLRARAIWTRSAHLQTGRQQPSMRRINRPDTRKSLTQRPELDKENACVAGAGHVRKGRPRKKALPIPNND